MAAAVAAARGATVAGLLQESTYTDTPTAITRYSSNDPREAIFGISRRGHFRCTATVQLSRGASKYGLRLGKRSRVAEHDSRKNGNAPRTVGIMMYDSLTRAMLFTGSHEPSFLRSTINSIVGATTQEIARVSCVTHKKSRRREICVIYRARITFISRLTPADRLTMKLSYFAKCFIVSRGSISSLANCL